MGGLPSLAVNEDCDFALQTLCSRVELLLRFLHNVHLLTQQDKKWIRDTFKLHQLLIVVYQLELFQKLPFTTSCWELT